MALLGSTALNQSFYFRGRIDDPQVKLAKWYRYLEYSNKQTDWIQWKDFLLIYSILQIVRAKVGKKFDYYLFGTFLWARIMIMAGFPFARDDRVAEQVDLYLIDRAQLQPLEALLNEAVKAKQCSLRRSYTRCPSLNSIKDTKERSRIYDQLLLLTTGYHTLELTIANSKARTIARIVLRASNDRTTPTTDFSVNALGYHFLDHKYRSLSGNYTTKQLLIQVKSLTTDLIKSEQEEDLFRTEPEIELFLDQIKYPALAEELSQRIDDASLNFVYLVDEYDDDPPEEDISEEDQVKRSYAEILAGHPVHISKLVRKDLMKWYQQGWTFLNGICNFRNKVLTKKTVKSNER